jgi:serine protease DegQ
VKATEGVIITGVLQNGPAALAGIRPGDVITSVGGQSVGNVSELLSKVAALKPGMASEFDVRRGDSQLTANVVPGRRPQPKRPTRR